MLSMIPINMACEALGLYWFPTGKQGMMKRKQPMACTPDTNIMAKDKRTYSTQITQPRVGGRSECFINMKLYDSPTSSWFCLKLDW